MCNPSHNSPDMFNEGALYRIHIVEGLHCTTIIKHDPIQGTLGTISAATEAEAIRLLEIYDTTISGSIRFS